MEQNSFCEDSEAAKECEPGCLFCELPPGTFELLDQNELGMTLCDNYPVTEGHCLIIPRRHVIDYFGMTPVEIDAINRLIHRSRERLQDDDPIITGFNIGTNAGKSAGQSVFHFHMHVIPRAVDDELKMNWGLVPGDTEAIGALAERIRGNIEA